MSIVDLMSLVMLMPFSQMIKKARSMYAPLDLLCNPTCGIVELRPKVEAC